MKKIIILILISQFSYSGSLDSFLFNSNELKTESFKIIKDGKDIFSKSKVDESKKFILWSMSKSITSLLIGIAQDKGLLSIDDSVLKYVGKDLKSLSKKRITQISKITIKHVLEMSSGIDWNELYDSNPFRSHVVDMLYNSSIKSMGIYTLLQQIAHEPGEKFNYSSGDTNILNLILKNILIKNNYKTYPWDWLFSPLGIENASFEIDQSGTFVGSSYVYLSNKDLLKIGKLVLNKGEYNNKQVVSKEYIEYATSISKNMYKKYCLKYKNKTYGAQFWLNAACPDGSKPFEGVDEDLVMMLGYAGQNVLIFPSKKSLVIRSASDEEGALRLSKYLPLVQRFIDEN